MSLVINDGFVLTFDYGVEFDLDAQIGTITDLSTYTDTTGVTISIDIVFPTTGTQTVSLTPNGTVTFDLPTVNAQPAYGYYYFTATVSDSVDDYEDEERSFNLCKPEQCGDKSGSGGCLEYSVKFLCQNNKVLYQDTTDYVYKETDATSVNYNVTVIDPNNVTQVDGASVSSFTISPVVNGRYSFIIDNIALYEFDDNFSVTINYQATNEQLTAACDVNLCLVRCKIKEIYAQWKAAKGNKSQDERQLYEKWLKLTYLAWQVDSGVMCGDNVSDEVDEIEDIIGESCSCDCGSVAANPILCSCTEIVFEEGDGITIEETTAGDTTNVTITAEVAVVTSTDLDVTPTTVANVTTYDVEIPDLVWTDLTPTAGWTVSTRLQYSKDGYGNVYVRGKITRTLAVTTSYSMFTLPVNYRPSAQEAFVSVYSGTGLLNQPAQIDMTTGGVASFTSVGAVTACVMNCNLMFNVN